MVYATDDPGDHVDPGAVDAARRKVGTLCVESIVDDSPYQPLSAYLVEFASTDDAALVAAASDRRARPEGEYPACPPTWTERDAILRLFGAGSGRDDPSGAQAGRDAGDVVEVAVVMYEDGVVGLGDRGHD